MEEFIRGLPLRIVHRRDPEGCARVLSYLMGWAGLSVRIAPPVLPPTVHWIHWETYSTPGTGIS